MPKKSRLKKLLKRIPKNLFKALGLALLFASVAFGVGSSSIPNKTADPFSENDILNPPRVAGIKDARSPFGKIVGVGREPKFIGGETFEPSGVSAMSALAIDWVSGKTLFEKNPSLPLPPASTTKIVTALVVMENYDLSTLVSISKECLGLKETPNVGFLEGEKVSVENLLYGMLVKSASDASCALANIDSDHIAFIEKMNKKAIDLGLKDTHFTNEIGFDSKEDNHLSTASDLATLAREAMKNGVFRGIVMTKQVTIPSQINPKNPYFVVNTNELLFNLPGTTGVKTGNTEKAKGCLVFSYENLGKNILIVVMRSEDRFGDTKKILDWILSSYSFTL
ncbi:hypothetical protein COT49_01165 [candidate division WWE3 bacterium CG08_land_8_20_14_0_20_40_13]|uniref:Peptidase S11 D-alanyl-D-alanine carboxypeptidase A N-terminal domain-containing protein n=1 Tax=candidate division WWE3 bacterium CG08_land_8_20_14_0_20_40_13 TaxID=1975084 RepID=A0A2H0XGE9_UNCKA|nr:MAG: hypothetical protein COT49_01165 [candidate division WWE3 bacterium CG08_land_8_20_14_0_20_40_13]